MKRRNEIVPLLIPVVIMISLYLVFFNRITCKPGQAGFWIIIALGMSIGVLLTRIFQKPKEKNKF